MLYEEGLSKGYIPRSGIDRSEDVHVFSFSVDVVEVAEWVYKPSSPVGAVLLPYLVALILSVLYL